MLPVDPKTMRPIRASCGPIALGGMHSSCSSVCCFTSWLCESRARRTSCHRASRSISSWPCCSFPYCTFQWQIDGKAVPRSYSISSSPTQGAYIEITPKRVPDGYVSAFLNDHAAVGLEVEASGPFGQFYFDERRDQRNLLLAGGGGLTPKMAM